MKTLFNLATETTILTKQDQLDLWLIFSELIDLCEKESLPVNNTSIKYLKERYPTKVNFIRRCLKAKDQLIFANQGLVMKEATVFSNSNIGLDELIQIGNEGLLHALHKFDPTKNTKFSSYAYWWIRAAIFDALYHDDPIYVPNRFKKDGLIYSFVSRQDEDRLAEYSNSDVITRSTVNEVLLTLSEEDQDLLIDSFGLNGDSNLLSVALFRGNSYAVEEKRLNKLISDIKQAV